MRSQRSHVDFFSFVCVLFSIAVVRSVDDLKVPTATLETASPPLYLRQTSFLTQREWFLGQESDGALRQVPLVGSPVCRLPVRWVGWVYQCRYRNKWQSQHSHQDGEDEESVHNTEATAKRRAVRHRQTYRRHFSSLPSSLRPSFCICMTAVWNQMKCTSSSPFYRWHRRVRLSTTTATTIAITIPHHQTTSLHTA